MAEAWAQCKDRLDLIYLKLLKPAVEDFWFKLCEPLLSWSNALESSKIMLGCGKLQSPTQCFHYENYCTWEEKKDMEKLVDRGSPILSLCKRIELLDLRNSSASTLTWNGLSVYTALMRGWRLIILLVIKTNGQVWIIERAIRWTQLSSKFYVHIYKAKLVVSFKFL